jgi:alkylhydroperoxidase family enzyme
MALLNTPTEKDANPEVQAVFQAVKDIVTFVPRPTQMLATSPPILKSWWATQGHFIESGRFSRELLTYIRLLVSVNCEFPFCIEFNTVALKMLLGLSDEDVAEAIREPSRARLPANERAVLLFVLHAVREPEEISQKEIQELRDHGWNDQDIFEAAYYGTWMVLMGMLFNTFRMSEE